MKLLFLLLAIIMGPASAANEPTAEPAIVEAHRQRFLADMVAAGEDATGCHMEYLESGSMGHLVTVACPSLQFMCAVMLHPTEMLQRPLECIENPGYVVPDSAEKKTI
jgi:hypothetical protein